jgi:anti-sigma-K factor RskA
MRKPNYHQARKQKELSRKARQQEKQQRREVRTEPEQGSPQTGAPEGPQLADGQAADDPVGSGV